jgi:hypothetical protein
MLRGSVEADHEGDHLSLSLWFGVVSLQGRMHQVTVFSDGF